MSDDSGLERTEQATPKKIKESREKGQVARSRELNTMALLIASASCFLVYGQDMLVELIELFKNGLTINVKQFIQSGDVVAVFGDTALNSMIIVSPLFVVLVVVSLMTPIGIGGWSFSMKAISFKWEKIDPIKGIGRIFSSKGVMELLKVLAKFLLVSGVSCLIIWSVIDELLGLGNEPIQSALAHVAHLCAWSFIAYSSVLIIVAAIDAPFQLWQHNKQLKMTKQEVKDENKEIDGSPEVKGRIRAIQQELSQRRMMNEVPTADVIITNPTHYAVALRYDELSMRAPVVVAKGADLIAAQIRLIGEQNNIVIVSAPPLARALFSSTEIDQEIPAGLYIAVATILSYVYQLQVATLSGQHLPQTPDDLPIPDELIDVLKHD